MFPSIAGRAKIEIIEESTGEVVDTRYATNLVTDRTYLIDTTGSSLGAANLSSKRIFISASVATPTRSGYTSITALAIGAIPTGVTSGTYYDNADPPYGEIINDIGSIGSSRNFSTVGLTTQSSNNNYNTAIPENSIYAYLLLDDAPCTQGESQVVRITYHVQFPYSSEPLWKAIAYGDRMMGKTNSTVNTHGVTTSFIQGGYESEYNGLAQYHTDSSLSHGASYYSTAYGGTSAPNAVTATTYNDLFARQLEITNNYDDVTFNGFILNLFIVGRFEYDNFDAGTGVFALGSGRYTANSASEPFQVGFWHTTTETLEPFFDITYEGSSEGSVTYAGTWTGKIPIMTRIEIVAGGETGVATYRFQIKRICGFGDDSWDGRTGFVPWFTSSFQSHPNMYGWDTESKNDIQVYDGEECEVVFYAEDGVTLLNLYTGQCRCWDSSDSLNVTDIRQVTVTSGNIYVACANTGVWEIDVGADTVYHRVSGVGAYAIATAYNNEVFALCQGSLRSSTNWATGQTFTFTGISDGNWDLVRYMKASRTATDNELLLVRETSNGSGTYQMVWWDKTSATATGFATNYTSLTTAQSIKLLDSGTYVFAATLSTNYDIYKTTYGSTTATDTARNCGTRDPDNNPTLITTSGLAVLVNTNNGEFYNPDTDSVVLTSDQTPCSGDIISEADSSLRFSVELANGIIYVGRGFGDSYWGVTEIVPTDSSTSGGPAWESYGWDGAAWVRDDTGAKTTHSGAEDLIQGITVAFVDGTGTLSNSFITGNYLHRTVCKGLIKSDASTVTTSHFIYYKQANYSTDSGIIPVSGPYTDTLAAVSDPDFISIQDADTAIHTFTIAGSSIAALWFDGTAPGVNEISIDGSTGVMTFNASDAGKAWTASNYVWIGH